MAVQGVLEELGLPYQAKLVDMSKDEHKQAPYLTVNPAGKIPALQLEDGSAVTESAALCLFLTDRHPKAEIAPEANDPGRAAFLQWLFYLTNTLQPALLRFYYPERHTAAAGDIENVKRQGETDVAACWADIDKHLAQHGPYLLGERYSVADIFCFMLSTWQESCPKLYERFFQVKNQADLVSARPAIQRMLKQHG